jgi:hypothetical protein
MRRFWGNLFAATAWHFSNVVSKIGMGDFVFTMDGRMTSMISFVLADMGWRWRGI